MTGAIRSGMWGSESCCISEDGSECVRQENVRANLEEAGILYESGLIVRAPTLLTQAADLSPSTGSPSLNPRHLELDASAPRGGTASPPPLRRRNAARPRGILGVVVLQFRPPWSSALGLRPVLPPALLPSQTFANLADSLF